MKKELTFHEQMKPYARFFSQPMAPVPTTILEQLGEGPIDPAKALSIGQKNELLQPGYLPAEVGYCLMPDGSAFVAMLTKMPGVTLDMFNWWFVWHGLEGLRYKIWNPEEHYDVHVAREDLPRRLDPTLDLRERNWGTTDIVYEDVGTGAMELYISFLSPQEAGYDTEAFAHTRGITAVSANLGMTEPRTPLVTFTHFARETAEGIELRSRFWLGWNMQEGKPVQIAADVPIALAKGLAYHCAKEFTNLAAILPHVYAENAAIPDKLEDYDA
ncbi:DAPG hydrolase family protein [Brevibacillus fluminis]|uniref:DAPG hydrolase family protein n=1 Tax=Brevibacillus fluminis TaxID=511487 RepID=UPI003F8B4C1C